MAITDNNPKEVSRHRAPNSESFSNSVAGQQQALARMQGFLAELGIRALIETRVSLRVGYDGDRAKEARFPRFSPPEYEPPRLEIYGPRGETIATAVIGCRSGSYLVTIPSIDSAPRVVRPDRPGLTRIGADIRHAYRTAAGVASVPVSHSEVVRDGEE